MSFNTDIEGLRGLFGDHPDWYADAACAYVPNPEVFFPTKGNAGTQAKTICAGCPVQTDCIEFAVESGQTYGIWGGLNGKQLGRIRAARRRNRYAA